MNADWWMRVSDRFRFDTAGVDQYVAWDESIRQPVSSARRIDVISTAGGTGCTRLVASLARVVARRRGARVLGVDAGLGAQLTQLVSVHPDTHSSPTVVPSPDLRLHAPMTVNQADRETAGLLTGDYGLRVCRPGQATGLLVPRPGDWTAEVIDVTRYFDVVITDWGHRLVRVDFEQAIMGAHAVVLVCRADRFGVEQAVSVARAVDQVSPVVVCVTDVDGVGMSAARAAVHSQSVPIRFLPFLPDSARPGLLPARYRDVVIGLAATLMDATNRPGRSGGGL